MGAWRRRRRRETFLVMEEAQHPRWSGEWDGGPATGFDDVEEAIVYSIARARTVIIQTLGDRTYWIGTQPPDGYDGLRAWPPAAVERREIERNFEAKRPAAAANQAARQAYESARGRDPVHACLL